MNQQRDLEGISALVTGASSGIGRAAAEELGRHGAEVVAHGRDVTRGSAVVDTITAEGGESSPSGVRVNAIAAGPVLTPGAAPERIKASYVTGAVIAADGGRTAI
jgi:NAD(P)-dependent dehydrogenase (short-subunit alcohol dehydrogenase family)